MNTIDSEHLITEVKRRPVLWDQNHKYYNQRNAKLLAWQEVFANLIVDWTDMSKYDRFGKGKDIQNRWTNIRDTYMREIKYEKKVQKGLALPKKKYKFSHLLGFLDQSKQIKDKGKPTKENVAVQVTPPGRENQPINIATLSFLDNPDLMFVKVPKTPSPLLKTKVLEEADHLLAVAEKELSSVEAKISSDRLLSAKTSSSQANGLSARRIMAALPLSPTKGSIRSSSSLNSRSKTSYQVPPNSLSSFNVRGNEENYKRNNGEQKRLTHKLRSQTKDPKPARITSELHHSELEESNIKNHPDVTEFSMFYEQQKLVEKKTQSFEKNSATVIFKSDAKVVSSTSVVKQDAHTNTSPVLQNDRSNITFTRNSSIISMKTNKPEEEQPQMLSRKTLDVQKMPSVNIRPGFTIQHGPKINIVGSSVSSHKLKRKNTEFFDVVYPPSSPVFSESSFISDQGRQNKQTEYICDRHSFPSGRLVPGISSENLRENHPSNLDEKREVLIELIKSVTEKVEKQPSRGNKSCCRLICSLPLLASVVRKIQVDCVKCVDLLNSHLDRLLVLMKEELRGNREISDNHCCQLDETVHYQIVELELIQEENKKRQTAPVTVVRHKEFVADVRTPKKSVSFESIPDELAEQTNTDTRKQSRTMNIIKHSSQKIVPATSGKVSKISSVQPATTKTIQTVNRYNDSEKNTPTYQREVKQTNNNRMNPKKTNTSSNAKTVVGQVLKNLTQRKSILKHNEITTNSRSGTAGERSKVLNSYVKIVDHKETTSEFEKWIEERSLKIKQIHDELNKMVEGSMERYLETHAQKDENMRTTSYLKLLESSNSRIRDETCMKEPEETDERRDIKPQDVEEQQTKNRQITDNVLESSTQDDLQDYEEDFEEDVEEGTNVNSTGLEQQSGSEAEKESSESIIEEIVTVEEPIVGETAVTIQKLSSKVSNMIIGGKESLEQLAEVEVDKNKDVKLSPNQNILNNQTEAKTEKISIATSPINFNSTYQKTDASVNTSFALIENKKVTVATSPIIQTEKSLPHLKSTTVQTVNLSDSETKSVTSNRINVGETDLTVPSMRLTPKPIENIFNITLGETKENSVALQADQSNQTFKLTVQLHGSDKENKKIVELDSPNESGKILCYPEGRSESDQKSNTNISTNVRNQSSTQRGSKFYDTAEREKIDEQTIKSIIEPTVSEVLKKINTDSSHQNERSHPISMADTISSLVKPNIILQTKHGLWQKCNENPFPNIELEQPNPKVDSSNQTEAEKQNVSVQAVDSGTISCEDRPADHCEARPADLTRGYLEMLLPLPPSSLGTVTSCTLSHSSTCGSSSRSSPTSTSSNRKYEILRNSEKLSDGELLPEPCGCKVGEVCPVCVPRLDLSFGEVKTKKRSSRMENDSSSGSNRQTSVPLLNLPLHLEPRPSSVRITRTSELSDVTKSNNLPSDKLANYMTKVRDNLSVAGKVERKNVKHFSEVAQSVLDDLGKELSTLGSVKYTFPKPSPSISVIDPLKNPMDTSSSDSTKSQKGLRSKRNKQKHSLVIKKPVETPRIDAVIEDEELSTSSYQTSVTSVSVDQLPEVSSHSSADASS